MSVSNVDLDEWRAADKRAESNQLLVRTGYTPGVNRLYAGVPKVSMMISSS